MSTYFLFRAPEHASVRQKILSQPHAFCAGCCTGLILVQVHTLSASLELPGCTVVVCGLLTDTRVSFVSMARTRKAPCVTVSASLRWPTMSSRCKSHSNRRQSLGWLLTALFSLVGGYKSLLESYLNDENGQRQKLLLTNPLLSNPQTQRYSSFFDIVKMIKFIAFLALLSVASAIPRPNPVLARGNCQTVPPTTIDVLDVSAPDVSKTGHNFRLESTGNPISNTKISALTFAIPSGATGCVLRVHKTPVVSGNNVADVWMTSPWNAHSPPTWNNLPRKNEMVGKLIFPTDQSAIEDVKNIASNACSTTMSYLVEFTEPPRSEGSIEFYNTAGSGSKDAMGFDMQFNC